MKLAVIAAFLLAFTTATQASAQQNVKVAVTAASEQPKPGSTTDIVIRFEPRAGWHGYWLNPGEGGSKVVFRWNTPPGVSVGDPLWPAPVALDTLGLTSYVMDGAYSLVFPMKVSSSVSNGSPIPVSVDMNIFLCTNGLCSAQAVKGSVDLVAGNGQASEIGGAMAREARANLPKRIVGVEASRSGSAVRISVKGTDLPKGAKLFLANDKAPVGPDSLVKSRSGSEAVLDWSDAPATVSGTIVSDSSAWAFGPVSVKAGSADQQAPSSEVGETSIDGEDPTGVERDPASGITSPVVKVGAVDALGVPSDVRSVVPSQKGAVFMGIPVLSGDQSSDSVLLVLLGAFLGGLLLNLMPCVFPILSLKAMSLARSSANEETARVEGVGYALGTVATAVGLGAFILVMREFGTSAGWSFQLQSPAFVLAMLGLVVLITLNLSGSFEFAQLGRSAGMTAPGFRGAVGTGAMAAMIASPCAGPFMAGALGAALVLTPVLALTVFAGLGLGMAAPFLLVAFVPAVRSRLPRPGPWMGRLRRILAVPMALTAVWFFWLLWRQAGIAGVVAGSALVVMMSIGMQMVGRTQRKGGSVRNWVLATAGFAAVLLTSFSFSDMHPAEAHTESSGRVAVFSETALEQVLSEGTPVLLDFTADWCLTCKVNEKVALSDEGAIRALDEAGVLVMTGDWTNGDPSITSFLEKNGRNAIPFYVLYDGKGGAKVLPQILTPSLLIDEAEYIR